MEKEMEKGMWAMMGKETMVVERALALVVMVEILVLSVNSLENTLLLLVLSHLYAQSVLHETEMSPTDRTLTTLKVLVLVLLVLAPQTTLLLVSTRQRSGLETRVKERVLETTKTMKKLNSKNLSFLL